MGDWEDDSDLVHTQGKTFASRGRGFDPPADQRPGGGGGGGGRFGGGGGGYRSKDDNEGGGRRFGSGGGYKSREEDGENRNRNGHGRREGYDNDGDNGRRNGYGGDDGGRRGGGRFQKDNEGDETGGGRFGGGRFGRDNGGDETGGGRFGGGGGRFGRDNGGDETGGGRFGGGGGRFRRDDYDDNEGADRGFGGGRSRRDNDMDGGGGGGGFGGGRSRRDNEGDEDGDGEKKPPRVTYVPPEPMKEEEMFSEGITSGINFDNYEKIDVKVSGDHAPGPIRSFEEAGVRPLILENIIKSKYTRPTPIQKQALPIVMGGRDLMGCAQTGSGKTTPMMPNVVDGAVSHGDRQDDVARQMEESITSIPHMFKYKPFFTGSNVLLQFFSLMAHRPQAAFLIPIINALLKDPRDEVLGESHIEPQVVIVTPTRELTIQIFNEARKFACGSVLKVVETYGGVSSQHQLRRLFGGCHILVATPGRLMDFVGRGKISFASVRFVVLDEADRMLDMGFLGEMEKFMMHETMVPKGERQTLMFSATFPEEVQRLAGKFLHNYIFVAVGIVGGACSDVKQQFFNISKFEKKAKLVELLQEHGSDRTLVFVEQKRMADIIAIFLSEKQFPTTSIHGDREQREREEALRDFRSGKMGILVATAVAARGLDIKGVKHVINFDLPKSVDEFVHRIGRTGRVGNQGLATSFYDEEQDGSLARDLVRILSQAQQEVPQFLENAASGGYGGGSGGFSAFGGRDVRGGGGGRDCSDTAAPQQTVDDEEW